jgi:hypothetical protein
VVAAAFDRSLALLEASALADRGQSKSSMAGQRKAMSFRACYICTILVARRGTNMATQWLRSVQLQQPQLSCGRAPWPMHQVGRYRAPHTSRTVWAGLVSPFGFSFSF